MDAYETRPYWEWSDKEVRSRHEDAVRKSLKQIGIDRPKIRDVISKLTDKDTLYWFLSQM